MFCSALQAWLIHKQVATAETVPDLPKQLAFFFFQNLMPAFLVELFMNPGRVLAG